MTRGRLESPALAALVVLLVGARGLAQDQGAARPVTVPVQVICHFKDPEFRERAAATVREVWQLAARCLPLDSPGKLFLHVHNDVTSCKRTAKRFGVQTRLDLPGVLDTKRGAAHVFFWRSGWCRDARWRIGNLTMRLALLRGLEIAEEQQPAWLRQGMAQWGEGRATSAKGWVEDRSLLGLNSMAVVRQLLQQRQLPSIDAILRDRMRIQQRQQRAVHRLAWHFLMARHGDAMASAVRRAATAADPDALVATVVDSLRAELTESGYAGLDQGFAEYVKALPKTVDIEAYPAWDAVGKPGESGFVPASPSAMWLDKTSKSRFTVTARPQLVQVGQGDLVFERSRGRWIRVTILAHSGGGSVYVLERKLDRQRPVGWTVLGRSSADVATIRVGRSLDLRIEVRRKKMVVHVAGKAVLTVGLPGSLAGRYGVGGPFGNHVAWRQVRLR